MRRVVGVVICLIALSGAAIASARTGSGARAYSTPATAPLRTALLDPHLFGSAEQGQALAVAHHAGAGYLRVIVNWSSVAPANPNSSFDAANPDSQGYDWSELDAMVADAENAGLAPILDISETPNWAYSVRPKSGNAGTPNAAALAKFAHALAQHYSGSDGAPAVHLFQVWNEPNLSRDLSPVNPAVYRSMVNKAAAAIHGVDSGNIVVAGGLDPFGHSKTRKQAWYSASPLTFMRSLLCLSKGAHPHSTCKAQIHFDVWSHHPYTFGGPFGHARNKNDVSLGDLPRMRSLLRAGVRAHHVVSSRPVQFWVTEFSWDTNPPRRNALKVPLQARATAESLYQMWRSGVSLATWYLLQDAPGNSPYKCGLYFGGKPITRARAKPTLTAFRFPFVAYLGHGVVRVWGRDATSAKAMVTIQRRHGARGHWRTVAKVATNHYGIFEANLRLAATAKDWLRASSAGSGTSLAFSLTQPKYPHVGPWG